MNRFEKWFVKKVLREEMCDEAKIEKIRKEWNQYVAFLKKKYPEPENQEWAFTCQHYQRIDDILNGEEEPSPLDENWPPMTRNHQKEMVASYRKAYSSDRRSNIEILKCIDEIKASGSAKLIMDHWAISVGGFSEKELFNGRLNRD